MSQTNPSSHFDALLLEASKGDNKAFREIYNSIAGKMYSLCVRYAGNTNDANDWFQDGFIKLYRNLASFRGDGSFEGWARKIFVVTCIDGIKKRSPSFSEIEASAGIADANLSAYDKLSSEDLMDVIRNLPDNARTVVNLYFIEGYSHKEIGILLNISEEASRSQLFRARLLLKKILTES